MSILEEIKLEKFTKEEIESLLEYLSKVEDAFQSSCKSTSKIHDQSSFYRILRKNIKDLKNGIKEEAQKRETPQDIRNKEFEDNAILYMSKKIEGLERILRSISALDKYGDIKQGNKDSFEFFKELKSNWSKIKAFMEPSTIAAEERYLEEKRLGIIKDPFEE